MKYLLKKKMKELTRLEELENKILYAYFLNTQSDTMLQELAGDYLKEDELKEYRYLLDTV